ncbi:hypothetical protein M1D52_09445 [Olivibacter sp. SA151]|uniref:hypothetical protein n=1 Tax=Olivibacter jilunii TaxID=985016 RepID=UPI00280EF224
MKEIKTGIAVAAMAILTAVSFDAASKKAQNEELFFNISGVESTNPLDYEYRPNGGCNPSQQACSAIWEHTGMLSPGDNPNGPKVSANDQPGTYDGN